MINYDLIMRNKGIIVIDGEISVDDRGFVKYVNDFNFRNVKRFYHVGNFSKHTIRAFHGHKKESKYVYVAMGSIIMCLVKLTKNEVKLKQSKIHRFVLSSKKPQILFIPANYVNGFKALENNTSVIFFSTSTLKESFNDDIRYPYDFWGNEIWKTSNR